MVTVRERDVPKHDIAVVRFWDLAATKPHKKNTDPDWTAGCLMAVSLGNDPAVQAGQFYVLDCRKTRDTPAKIEQFIWDAHTEDDQRLGRRVPIRIEQEGGSSGVYLPDIWARGRFAGLDFKGEPPKGSKLERFKPFCIAAEYHENVHVVQGEWNEEWVAELELAGQGQTHDDQQDATSGAFDYLSQEVRLASVGAEVLLANDIHGREDDDFGGIGWGAIR